MTDIVLPCGRTVQIDEADRHLLDGRNWHSDKRGQTYYARGRLTGETKGGAYLHTLLMGGRADHKNGDGLDNRRENLRPCTQHQNLLNKAPKAGKKYKGVFFDKRRNHFYAQVVLNRKVHSSPRFDSQEDAARWHDAKALELHGAFARLNFPEGETVLRMLDRKDARQGEMFGEAA